MMLVTLALATLALVVFFLAAMATAADPIQAASPGPTDWVIVTSLSGTLSIVDASNDIVYGPVLSGELGTLAGEVLDVAVTPNGDTALISNFGDQTVYFVDFSNPISPSVITSVTLPMLPEDIAITPDGRFALVTDGGFSSWVASLDIVSRTLVYTADLGALDAQAVDIAPDGTVIVADYWGGLVHTLLLNASGHLTYTGSYSYTITPDGGIILASCSGSLARTVSPDASSYSMVAGRDSDLIGLGESQGASAADDAYLPWPTNLAIAPDGQTVIVCDAFPYYPPTSTLSAVGIYRITAPGVLSFTGAITRLTRSAQSVAFSPAGDKAYLSGNGGDPTENEYDQLSVLDITGPGMVSLNMDNAADLPRMTSGHFFGVDTIAVANGKAYVAYPVPGFGVSNDLRVVDLTDYSVKRLSLVGESHHGVAVIPMRRIYLPLAQRNAP
jgi:DNA-binding beta-propeller fold protein YncE